MARIRSIKPDFWTSEQVMECSPNARLLFIGMWNFADDHGRLPNAPKTLKAQIFPADEITAENVRRMVDELSSNDLVRSYSIDGKEFLYITGWHHQKIDRRQAAKYPDPPRDVVERSPNDLRTVSTDLRGSEGKGSERSGAKDTRASALVVDDGWPENFKDQFWDAYPNKVGKPKALAKLEGCRKRRVEWTAIMQGLARYIESKPPDRAWLNPETFLNQERWADQPAPPATQQGQQNGRRTVHDAANDLLARVRALDEPAPRSLCDGEGEGAVRLLPPR